MGADVVSYPAELSDAWRRLAADLLSPAYRAAMSALIGFDLSQAPMEVNVFHYGPGGSLGPHRDLPEKIVTHVLYFNEAWNPTNGGCLRILRSVDSDDVAAEIPPLIGNSSVLVRSENSWHAVSLVAQGASSSRRSVTVTFYRPGAVSTMWPPGDATPLNWYDPANSR
jgi:SM-20-related protein